jgi:hypothetical protein
MKSPTNGYVRLCLDAVLSSPFCHLMSGVDESPNPSIDECGTPTSISGYTEWVSADDTPISLGWDWVLEVTNNTSRLVRVGDPRTNVMLIDEQRGEELGWTRNIEVLSTVVDALPWEEQARRAIDTLYS